MLKERTFSVHPGCPEWQGSFPFSGWIIFHWRTHHNFLHLFTYQWILMWFLCKEYNESGASGSQGDTISSSLTYSKEELLDHAMVQWLHSVCLASLPISYISSSFTLFYFSYMRQGLTIILSYPGWPWTFRHPAPTFGIAGVTGLSHQVRLNFYLLEEPPDCFLQWLDQFIFLPTVHKDALSSTWSTAPHCEPQQ